MAYLNSELLELIIIATFAVAIFYYFWETLPSERSLNCIAWGITIMTVGVAIHYVSSTPLKSLLISIVDEEYLGIFRPGFYILGGILSLLVSLGGSQKW
ncbi:MAG: hypothetical protein JKX94_05780 [Sneathiella sp.]|nr:hypothetical protein [Sneathiella sp.]